MDCMPQIDPADRYRQTATRAAAGLALAPLSAAARRALGLALASATHEHLREIRGDLAAIGADLGLVRELRALEADGTALVGGLLLDAILAGYRETGEAEAADLGLVLTIEPGDRTDLEAYPIAGHTPADWAARLVGDLVFRIRGELSRQVLAGKVEPLRWAESLVLPWADQVGARAADAWHAGRSAARLAMADALRSRRGA
jgi:hypothetical protein